MTNPNEKHLERARKIILEFCDRSGFHKGQYLFDVFVEKFTTALTEVEAAAKPKPDAVFRGVLVEQDSMFANQNQVSEKLELWLRNKVKENTKYRVEFYEVKE